MNEQTQRVELSAQQIEKLFAFVRSKYVRYVDLQYELVDHLASSIESQMSEDSRLTFDQALAKSYSEFPVTGFTNFVYGKQKALLLFWNKKFWSFFKSYFTFPKVVMTIGIFIGCFWSISTWEDNGIIAPALIVFGLMLYSFYQLYLISDNVECEKYLFLSTYKSHIIGATFIPYWTFYIIELLFKNNSVFLSTEVVLLSAILTMSIVSMHAISTAFPQLIKDEIKSKYGHLNIRIYA